MRRAARSDRRRSHDREALGARCFPAGKRLRQDASSRQASGSNDSDPPRPRRRDQTSGSASSATERADTEKWYADGLVDFVEQAGAIYKPINGVPRRVAVNVAGSGKGGARLDKGTLLKTIVPRLTKAAAANRIDVVLVCHGRRQYEAAQRVRRDLAGDQPEWLTPELTESR